MVLLSPLMVVPLWVAGERGRQLSHLGFRLWGGSFWLMGLCFHRTGKPLDEPGVLFVANHSSLLDTPAIFWTNTTAFKVLGKVEFARFPFFGYLYAQACVLVDRSKSSSRAASLTALARELGRGGRMVVFPEGRMNPDHHTVRPMAEAALQLALRQGAVIQPVAVENAGPLLPASGRFLIKPGTVTAHYLEPIRPGRVFEPGTLAPYVEQLIAERLGMRRAGD